MDKAKQRVKFEVAWQIFDEINEENNQFKHIDLSCLDFDDAIAITKQKIFDLANEAHQNWKSGQSVNMNYIYNIKCADDHLINIEDHLGRAPLKNCILEMIKHELQIDHHYVSAQRTILVRIDRKTINIQHFSNRDR